MTRSDLEQLRSLPAEIAAIQRDIDNLPVVVDTVTGSRRGIPYDKHAIPIEGVDVKRFRRLRAKLRRRCDELQDKIDEMEDWLDTVEDSEMRTILRLRFRNGISWQQIAFEIRHHDEQYPRRKCNKFLDNIKNDENDEK